MARDNAPVGHTCPMIDGVLDSLNAIYLSSEEISKSELQDFQVKMEKIRSHNGALRDWGNDLFEEKKQLENEVESLSLIIDKLKSEIENYKYSVRELEAEISLYA
jgi:predicted RNA-binding protein with EMAP domain